MSVALLYFLFVLSSPTLHRVSELIKEDDIASFSPSQFDDFDDEIVSSDDERIIDFTTLSNEENKSYEEEDPGEIAVCVPDIVGSPPQRQSSRARRKPIRFANEYDRYYK